MVSMGGTHHDTRLSFAALAVAMACSAAAAKTRSMTPASAPNHGSKTRTHPAVLHARVVTWAPIAIAARRPHRAAGPDAASPANLLLITYPPDPRAGRRKIDPATNSARRRANCLAGMLPPRTDLLRRLVRRSNACTNRGEPYAQRCRRACRRRPAHPSEPPQPFDLVGLRATARAGRSTPARAAREQAATITAAIRTCIASGDWLFDCFYTHRCSTRPRVLATGLV